MTYEKLSNISLLYRKRQERNKDVLMIISGEKGDGKSNAGMQSARDYLEKFGMHCNACHKEFVYTGKALSGDRHGTIKIVGKMVEPCPYCKSKNTGRIKRFNFFNWLAYDADEVSDMIYKMPKFGIILSDELARFALAENWNSAESKEMKKLLIQCRTKNLVIIGSLPEFVTLDKKYRNMANYWVRILQRDNKSACAIFIKRSKGEFDDKYHMKELQEILGDYFEETPMDDITDIAEKLVQKHPCVEDYFMIPPMPQDMYDDYEKYRDAKVFEKKQEDLEMDERVMAKIILYNIKKNWKELTDAVKAGRFDSPSLKMMEDFITRNPRTGNALIRYTTIRNHIRDIEAVVRAGNNNAAPVLTVEEGKE